MRAALLHADRELDLAALPAGRRALVADLGLDALVAAMARGDRSLDDVARRVVPAMLTSEEAVRYRQASVADALRSPALVRELYALAVDTIDAERRVWGGSLRSAEMILDRAAEVLGVFLDAFRVLRRISTASAGSVSSPGFRGFFARVDEELDDAFLRDAADHFERLRDRTLHVSAGLGPGNRGAAHVLHRRPPALRTWRDRVGLDEGRGMTVVVPLRDQNSMNMIAEVRALAIAPIAGVVHETAQQILGFFQVLRAELGFLLGCCNLAEALEQVGARTCVGDPVPGVGPALTARGLYDPCLALAVGHGVVGNDVAADGRALVVVTGANGGGKSTLLRAVGLAQVMLQAGMPIAADAFSADLRSGVLTHFTREEDSTLEQGRLHEELARLSALVDEARPSSLVLLNETLASTNEREGAEIARGVVGALVDAGVRVWFVTHIHAFAADLQRADPGWALFLRAERGVGGDRSFRVVEGPPRSTSHADDIYRRVVGSDLGPVGGTADPGV